MTFEELRGENTLTIVGTVGPMLREIDRATGGGSALEKAYRREALSGDYENVLAVTERYGRRYLPETLGLTPEAQP